MRIHLSAVIAILALLLPPVTALAENSSKIPGHTVHHNALLTSDLSPEVAKAYDIRRSTNRAMINIAVIKDVPGTTGTPVTADVSVMARNLRGQLRTIPVREIKEAEAVYYIGDFLVENQETVDFTIEVKPDNAGTSTVTLRQQFFTRSVSWMEWLLDQNGGYIARPAIASWRLAPRRSLRRWRIP